ncbi:MAG TPA: hypothetical protein PLV58_07105 [Campylobacterales bacterium]|nr:hypothetical protein [Campylobacterales bacterium]
MVFSQASSEYTYKQAGNQIQIYLRGSLVTTILLDGDGDGVELIFANGSANAALSNKVMTIGKASSCAAMDAAGSFDSNLVIPAPSYAIIPILALPDSLDDITTIAASPNIALMFSENIPKNYRQRLRGH